jgi:hypothetical protein
MLHAIEVNKDVRPGWNNGSTVLTEFFCHRTAEERGDGGEEVGQFNSPIDCF